MRVLLVGGGGREHALAWALRRSASVTSLVCAPGNPGIEALGDCRPIRADDIPALRALAQEVRPDLVVVGPEAPLASGLGDELRAAGFSVFGPGRAGARLESSKAWAKELMLSCGVPTARAHIAGSSKEARTAIARLGGRCVVKADGLAAGKGVVIPRSSAEAEAAADAFLSGSLGEAGKTVVIEERLEGPEISLHGWSDGDRVVLLPAARDHKRLSDGDAGPNTGGMGAVAPVPLPGGQAEELCDSTLRAIVRALAKKGIEYRGVLYAGLLMSSAGPRVLEYNCRFGDPESQALMPLMPDDFAEHLRGAASGRLLDEAPGFRAGAAVCVVLAAAGYPEAPRTGDAIEGLEAAAAMPGISIFQAGTRRGDGGLVTAGGRVLGVTAAARDVAAARRRAYEAAEAIRFAGMHMRRDVGVEPARAETAVLS